MRTCSLVARHRWAQLLLLGGITLLASVPALRAQTAADEMRAMREEMAHMRQELDALKEEVRRLKGGEPAAVAAVAAPSQERYAPPAAGVSSAEAVEEQPSPAEALSLLQAQVAEHAQTKVESNSKLPVKIFGTIVANTFFNTGEANWIDSPNIALPPPGSSLPSGSFSMTLRQSRFGAIIDGPAIGSWKSSGLIAVDFFGGVPNFPTGQVMGLPRLLYAFARLEGARTAIEVGQDHMILAPRNPTSLAAMSFPDLYRSGNLYLRVPQARVERSFATGTAGEVHAVVGILAPVAGDFAASSFVFVPPNLAGERSRMPAFQGRLAWRARPQSVDRGLEFGASGHYGREKYATGGIPSWAAALDLDAQVGRVGLGGEWYVGKNLDAFGGSLGQLAKSAGGFVEGRLRATSRLEFNTGVGRDRLFDLNFYPAALAGNTGVYANTIFRWTPEFASSFEYRWLSTMPRQGEARRNNHLNFVLAYSF
jgi:hypothetical protein